MEPLELPWGLGEPLPLRLPPQWRVVACHRPRVLPPLENLTAAVQAQLGRPIGAPPLRDLVGPGTRVALVMDDASRPTPVPLLAPLVLEHLLAAGVRPEHVTGLFAIGTHRPLSQEEMAARAGASVVSRIRCLAVDCHDAERFAFLGRTRRGTPVYLNRFAVEADLRVLIGTVEPHPQAGFGGGLKNLFPGLASAESIGRNHLIAPSGGRYNLVGSLPEENPMRQDLEEAGRMAGPSFLLNVVLGPDLRPVGVFAGDPVAAHREAVQLARSLYGAPLRRRVDIVVTNAHPLDTDLRQAGKALLNVAGACRPGGAILGFLRCEEGLGNVPLPGRVLPLGLARAAVQVLGHRGIAFLARHLPRAVPVEARFLVRLGLHMLRDHHVRIYSPRLMEAAGGRFPPVLYADQDRLFQEAERLAGTPAPEVAVFPWGGVSFPIFALEGSLT
ncbi:MAG: nickel-dependent lactate racemase [Anaerolineae bacterium]